MAIKRMRIFAGPNGSGKTTIIKSLQSEIGFGVYVNADDIESQLRVSQVLLFNTYNLRISQDELHEFFRNSTFSPFKRNEPELWKSLSVDKNILHTQTTIDSYLAADLAEFIRQKLLTSGISFTYETVMSHKSKLDFLQKAKDNEYRIYLYFIATKDPQINIGRVNARVAQDGHFVPPKTIIDRYYKSLTHLKQAIKTSNRAYIWDNSMDIITLIAEITDGIDVKIVDLDNVPIWFVKYVVD
jgi:predicted ABC-type ATPase